MRNSDDNSRTVWVEDGNRILNISNFDVIRLEISGHPDRYFLEAVRFTKGQPNDKVEAVLAQFSSGRFIEVKSALDNLMTILEGAGHRVIRAEELKGEQ